MIGMSMFFECCGVYCFVGLGLSLVILWFVVVVVIIVIVVVVIGWWCVLGEFGLGSIVVVGFMVIKIKSVSCLVIVIMLFVGILMM